MSKIKNVEVVYLKHVQAHAVIAGKDRRVRVFCNEKDALRYAGVIAEENHVPLKYPMPEFARLFVSPRVEVVE